MSTMTNTPEPTRHRKGLRSYICGLGEINTDSMACHECTRAVVPADIRFNWNCIWAQCRDCNTLVLKIRVNMA
jgi:hypothetical protein